MKTKYGETKLRTICMFLAKHSDDQWVKYTLKPLLTSLPVAVGYKAIDVTGVVKYIDKKAQASQNLSDTAISIIHFFAIHPKITTVACIFAMFIWVVFGKLITEFIKHYAKPMISVEVETAITLLEALDHPLKVKADRFAKASVDPEILSNPDKTFYKITKPGEQISLLTHACFTFLKFIDTHHFKEKGDITGGLLKFENGKPSRWVGPHSISATPDELNHPKSSVMTAAKTKKPVVISDIQKAIKKKAQNYLPLQKNHNEEKGSLICYPLYHMETKTVPYVLSIHSEEPGYFKEPDFIVKWGIERFAERILLEHSLEIIRQRAHKA